MTKHSGLSKFQKLSSIQHLGISLVVAILSLVVANWSLPLDSLTTVMFGWVIFCAVQIGISWFIFFKTTARQTQLQANLEDEGRAGIFILVLLATFAGLAAVFLVLAKTDAAKHNHWIAVTLAVLGMALSWFLVHTIFTVKYAHVYYGSQDGEESAYPKGLNFPAEEKPDFIDFAYYALVIGMTFQVSDVNITGREMRRLTLLHSVISFIFNTCIIALTINAIAGSMN